MSWKDYDKNAEVLSERYESVSFEEIHPHIVGILEQMKQHPFVLDVGAGSGRDASWFACRGYEVVAVEPSERMRNEAQKLHAASPIQWVDDSLPSLAAVHRLGLSFDLIMLSAVWMHVKPDDRARAMRKLVTLLSPGGHICFSLRMGPQDPAREMYAVAEHELDILAREHGLCKTILSGATTTKDKLGREDISWITVVYKLPDDGLGGLPLLRHIILRDDKSSTYKLALLRILARIADSSNGIVRIENDHAVVPLGLVALHWLRAFIPLIRNNLPQSPNHQGENGLGFVKQPFLSLLNQSPQDLRVGMTFDPVSARALRFALNDASNTITKMPGHHITAPGTNHQVFKIQKNRLAGNESRIITADYLWSFGSFAIPLPLWKALANYAIWVEPVIVMEWARLMEGYLKKQEKSYEETFVRQMLRWIDPVRDVVKIRNEVSRLKEAGHKLFCVWSGSPLRDNYEVDHCFPYSVWPCDDLWNLYPANRNANQQKSDKLMSRDLLFRAQEKIFNWWDFAFLAGSSSMSDQFFHEAALTLPVQCQPPKKEEVFSAMDMHRSRMKQVFNMSEWNG